MTAVWCMVLVQSQNQPAVGTVMGSPLTVMELSAISPTTMIHHRDNCHHSHMAVTNHCTSCH